MTTARRLFGFTLIELLLTIGIVSILFTLAIPAYIDFQNNQELRQERENLVTNLRFAQSQALGGVRTSCAPDEKLTGWYVSFTQTSYSIGYYCDLRPVSLRLIDLSKTSITFSIDPLIGTVIFRPNNQAVGLLINDTVGLLSGDYTMTLMKGPKNVRVKVRGTGDIF